MVSGVEPVEHRASSCITEKFFDAREPTPAKPAHSPERADGPESQGETLPFIALLTPAAATVNLARKLVSVWI